MQPLAKFEKILYMGFRATWNFRKWLKHQLIKSGNNDPSKSTSWKVLETVLSHLKFIEIYHLKWNTWFRSLTLGHDQQAVSFFKSLETNQLHWTRLPAHMIHLKGCALFHNPATILTLLTCSFSGLIKVVHQNREQNTKAESHTKIDRITNRCWKTHDPWPRTILETFSSEEPWYFSKALRGVLFFYHFKHPRYRPIYFSV